MRAEYETTSFGCAGFLVVLTAHQCLFAANPGESDHIPGYRSEVPPANLEGRIGVYGLVPVGSPGGNLWFPWLGCRCVCFLYHAAGFGWLRSLLDDSFGNPWELLLPGYVASSGGDACRGDTGWLFWSFLLAAGKRFAAAVWYFHDWDFFALYCTAADSERTVFGCAGGWFG